VSAPASTVPRFSDARRTVRWLGAIVLPLIVGTIVVTLVVRRPEPALAVGLVGASLIAAVVFLGVLWGRPPRVEPV
jgi:hypothetical protein